MNTAHRIVNFPYIQCRGREAGGEMYQPIFRFKPLGYSLRYLDWLGQVKPEYFNARYAEIMARIASEEDEYRFLVREQTGN